MFAFQPSLRGQSLSVMAIGFFIAGAFFVHGGLIRFLSGIPRSLKEPRQNNRHQENTNLEQISDWLTKILVGVGLVQLTRIPTILQLYTTFINPFLGNQSSSGALGIVILVIQLMVFLLVIYGQDVMLRKHLKKEQMKS